MQLEWLDLLEWSWKASRRWHFQLLTERQGAGQEGFWSPFLWNLRFTFRAICSSNGWSIWRLKKQTTYMAIKKKIKIQYMFQNKVINYIVFDSHCITISLVGTQGALSIIVASPQTKLRSQWRPDPLFWLAVWIACWASCLGKWLKQVRGGQPQIRLKRILEMEWRAQFRAAASMQQRKRQNVVT